MLDTFEIFTTSGIVLWSRTYVPISSAVINSLITNVFIEEVKNVRNVPDVSAIENPPYTLDKHILKWTTVKELGLIFVAVYRSLFHLPWVDNLVNNVKTIFVQLYGNQLHKPHSTIIVCDFDEYFDQQIQEFERFPATSDSRLLKSDTQSEEETSLESDSISNKPLQLSSRLSRENIVDLNENGSLGSSPKSSPIISRSSTPTSQLLKGKSGTAGKSSRRARKAHKISSANTTEGSKKDGNRPVVKKGRKWDEFGPRDEADDMSLDYSATLDEDTSVNKVSVKRLSLIGDIENDSWGSKTSNKKFVLKDLDDQVTNIPASADTYAKNSLHSNGILGSSLGFLGGFIKNFVGGNVLTKDDLEKTMKSMEEHLLKKNIAREAAIRLCEGVEKQLIGTKTANFESVQSKIRTAMESSLRKILTPTSSLDLLREIEMVTMPLNLSVERRRPYVISVVGVNGVGKSTSLSKICYFLLKNKLKVLIVACDTFRSGAVEQLEVHVRNLQELTDREGGFVQLFQKGYGKDAANVARDAVTFATQENFDVVLIDTAGRRHNDQRLMSSLEKFAKFANPDKILMVAEALVGTDSVAQARNFNAAFGKGRALDGFIISKCDTVGDMVGTLVSMVHATNVPILFVGVGQHYNDLRNLSVKWAVEKLLSNN